MLPGTSFSPPGMNPQITPPDVCSLLHSSLQPLGQPVKQSPAPFCCWSKFSTQNIPFSLLGLPQMLLFFDTPFHIHSPFSGFFFVRTLNLVCRWHLNNCHSFSRHVFSICPSRDCEPLEVRDDVTSNTLCYGQGTPNTFVDWSFRLSHQSDCLKFRTMGLLLERRGETRCREKGGTWEVRMEGMKLPSEKV